MDSSLARRAMAILVVSASLLWASAPVAAQPGNQGSFMGIVTQVEISGPTEVCTNVEYSYTVDVIRYWLHGVIANTTYVNMGSIAANVTLDVSGQGASGRTTVFAGATFPARFANPGSYTLTASAVTSTTTGSVDPATAVITAKSCDYEIQALSVWYNLPFGLRPWVGGVMPPVLLRPDASGNYLATGTLETFAIGNFACANPYDISDPEVTIRAVARSSGTTLAFSLDYADGTAVASVRCPEAGASSRPAPYSIQPISSFLSAAPLGGVDVWVEAPHTITTIGRSSGVTHVILRKLP